MSIRGDTLYTMGDFMCNPGAGSRRIPGANAAEHHEQQSVQLAHYEAAIPPQHDDRPILETYDLASKNRTERINLPQGQGIYEGVETYPRIIPMLIDLRG